MKRGNPVATDTRMLLAGISTGRLGRLGFGGFRFKLFAGESLGRCFGFVRRGFGFRLLVERDVLFGFHMRLLRKSM